MSTRMTLISTADDRIRRDLPKACAELAAWWDTGLLRDGVLREAAALLPEGIQDPIHLAERLTARMAVRQIASGKRTA